jgi:ammonium transporter, Amt family
MKKILLILSFMSILCLSLLNLNVGFAAENLDAISTFSATEPIMLAETSPDATPAAPDEASEPAPVLSEGNTAWMIVATVLVIMMSIPGIALFYGGLVRSKNMLSVLMQVFVTFSLISIIWVVYGYSLAFSDGGAYNDYIGGLSKIFLKGIGTDTLSGTIPEFVFTTFQLTFAALTPALIVGAFAERIKFSSLLVFMVLWVTAVYLPIAHMVWGGGVLATLGAKDFAGGTVVHINAGIAALVGAIVIGKRIGYGKEAMPPHNLVMTMIGASLLWVGWFGFNVGSELAADGTAGLVLINTQIATAAAVLGWVFIEWLTRGKPSMLGGASGAVAGLVAITPACAFVGPLGAIALGFIASIVCFYAVTGLKKALGYDDSLDVFGVHGVGGIVGAIGTGIFMSPDLGGGGFAEGITMSDQVYIQAIAVGVTVLWSGIVSYILFKVIDATMGLRVKPDAEREGLDTSSHGETAYHN